MSDAGNGGLAMLPIYDIHSVQNRLQSHADTARPSGARGEGSDFAAILRAEVLRASESDDSADKRVPYLGPEQAAGRDDFVHLDAVKQATDAATRRLEGLLARHLSAAGVDLEREIILVATPMGDLRVANSHPNALEIEHALSAAPGVQSEVGLIAAGAELLRAAQEHRTFVSLYELDPSAAAARHTKIQAGHPDARLHIALDDGAVRRFHAVAPEPVAREYWSRQVESLTL